MSTKDFPHPEAYKKYGLRTSNNPKDEFRDFWKRHANLIDSGNYDRAKMLTSCHQEELCAASKAKDHEDDVYSTESQPPNWEPTK